MATTVHTSDFRIINPSCQPPDLFGNITQILAPGKAKKK
jgi:hypothetical protein